MKKVYFILSTNLLHDGRSFSKGTVVESGFFGEGVQSRLRADGVLLEHDIKPVIGVDGAEVLAAGDGEGAKVAATEKRAARAEKKATEEAARAAKAEGEVTRLTARVAELEAGANEKGKK